SLFGFDARANPRMKKRRRGDSLSFVVAYSTGERDCLSQLVKFVRSIIHSPHLIRNLTAEDAEDADEPLRPPRPLRLKFFLTKTPPAHASTSDARDVLSP